MRRFTKDWDNPIDKPWIYDADGDPVRRMAGFDAPTTTTKSPTKTKTSARARNAAHRQKKGRKR